MNLEDTPTVIWRVGQPWRDLRPELAVTDATIIAVTSHGSVRALNPVGEWQLRSPAPGHSRIAGDHQRIALTAVAVFTPCGIVTWGRSNESWSASTALTVVYLGRPRDSERVLAAFGAVDDPDPGRHPGGPCGAAYCPNQDPTTWRPPIP